MNRDLEEYAQNLRQDQSLSPEEIRENLSFKYREIYVDYAHRYEMDRLKTISEGVLPPGFGSGLPSAEETP